MMANKWRRRRTRSGDTEGGEKTGETILKGPGQRQYGHSEGDRAGEGERKEKG